MDQNPERRRGHFHRGRRGSDRRGSDRRTPPAQEQGSRDHVDVEQIMRDIRARIAQRQGIELSDQQIQELAARRLESILDPRSITPALLDELRRSAGVVDHDTTPSEAKAPYTFEESTIYESHRGVLTLIRRLLNPLLKLFFNPSPLVQALNVQARLNVEAVEREAERERRQAEWNALHYEIVQRLVTEIARLSLEMQAQALRIESLSGRVDFNDRRVRGIEGVLDQSRPSTPRPSESAPPVSSPEADAGDPGVEPLPGEAPRRRRRRRRGRRGGTGAAELGQTAQAELSEPDVEVLDEGTEPVPVTTEGEALIVAEPAAADLVEEESAPAAAATVPESTPEAAEVPADSGQRDQ